MELTGDLTARYEPTMVGVGGLLADDPAAARDLFAAAVLLGVALAVYRRWGMGVPRLVSNSMDLYAIVAVALIIVSGFLLEGVKITSRSVYLRMVQEYADLSTPEEERALEAYWVAKFGLVSPAVKGPIEEGLLRMGEELHEMSCAGCHSRPRWAFLGYGVARAIKPVALPLDRAGAAEGLWWVHVLACLVALAFLPFSKFFHLLTAPLCLLCNAVMERGRSSPANLATKRMIELDACTHCGTCTMRCSAAPVVEVMPNSDVLPSEKIASLKVLASGKELSRRRLEELLEGIYLCTNCYRCTVVCPVGIDLQDLWFEAREAVEGRVSTLLDRHLYHYHREVLAVANGGEGLASGLLPPLVAHQKAQGKQTLTTLVYPAKTHSSDAHYNALSAVGRMLADGSTPLLLLEQEMDGPHAA